MNKRVKKKWIEALRSGEYFQTRGQLLHREIVNGKPKDSFCCLGVLCNIHSEETGTKWTGVKSANPTLIKYQTSYYNLPDDVRKWANLPYDDLKACAEDALTTLNDDGNSFKSIANWIEKNL